MPRPASAPARRARPAAPQKPTKTRSRNCEGTWVYVLPEKNETIYSSESVGGYGCSPSTSKGSKSPLSITWSPTPDKSQDSLRQAWRTHQLHRGCPVNISPIARSVPDRRGTKAMRRPAPKMTRAMSEPECLEMRAQVRQLDQAYHKVPASHINWKKSQMEHLESADAMCTSVIDTIAERRSTRLSARGEALSRPGSARRRGKKELSQTQTSSAFSSTLFGSTMLDAYLPTTHSIAVQTDIDGNHLMRVLGRPSIAVTKPSSTDSQQRLSAERETSKKKSLRGSLQTTGEMALVCGRRRGSSMVSQGSQGSPRRPEWDWEYHRSWSDRAFTLLDVDRDGNLERKELYGQSFDRVMRELLGDNLPESFDTRMILEFIFRAGDADGNGLLSRGEFQFLTWRLKCMENDLALEADFLFSIFDADGDDRLGPDEFLQLFKFLSKDTGESSKAFVENTMMSQIGRDNDGNITKEEYKRWSSQFLESPDLDT